MIVRGYVMVNCGVEKMYEGGMGVNNGMKKICVCLSMIHSGVKTWINDAGELGRWMEKVCAMARLR